MTEFDKKIRKQLKKLKVSSVNIKKEQYHLFADIVELVCLISNSYVSADDIIDRLTDNGFEIRPEKEKLDGEIGQEEAEQRDAEEGWVTVVFEHLERRYLTFNENYPFDFESEGISLKKESLNSSQNLYIFLLVASMLNVFDELKHEITSEFEVFSEEVLKAYLPSRSIVHGFGANTSFKGSARKKILELAENINLDVRNRVIEQISKYNSKEEGLDVVGWIPFEDNNPNTIIIFGQCACGQNWINKQNETKRYDRFYDPYIQPFLHALFIPHDLKNIDGRFEIDKDINTNYLVFERRRMLELSKGFEFDESFKSKKIIEKILDFEEELC